MQPPDKRKTPPVEGGAFQIDCNSSKIERPQYTDASQFHQGKPPLALLPCPVAVAKQFGFCHAVFVRHQGGRVERRGLFESAKNAACAAKELNRLFSQERGTGA